jgi:hypothetical protein
MTHAAAVIAFRACEILLASVIESIDGELLADTGGPYVRVRIDRWMVELIAEFVESERPSDIRAFVREAVVTHLGLR